MKTTAILGAALLVSSGCAAAPMRADEAAINRGQRHSAQLMQIGKHCGLPADSFAFEGDRLSFNPPADASYASVDCALRKIKRSRAVPRMGFVGNERTEAGKN